MWRPKLTLVRLLEILLLVLLLSGTGYCCMNDDEVRQNERGVKSEYAQPALAPMSEMAPAIVPTVALVGLLLLWGRRKA